MRILPCCSFINSQFKIPQIRGASGVKQMGRKIDGTRRARLMLRLLGETCLSTSGSRLALAILLAAGTLSTTLPARAEDWPVYNEGDLHFAIFNADYGDTIRFYANVTLTANLPPVRSGNMTINGQGFTLSGNNQYRGLFVQQGAINVAIKDLTITNAKAEGGKGGDARFIVPGNPARGGGGGGGAGLGGALFIGKGANVTVSNVNLQANQARGGNGGALGPLTLSSSWGSSGGGGGYWPIGADGGDGGASVSGGGGAPDGAGGDGSITDGSPGGFGGGGGGSGWCSGSDCPYIPGAGGFGGGSGAGSSGVAEPGGFGGGTGTSNDVSSGGGGGAGLGGAIFVQEGGSLTLAGALNISGNAVAGGDGGRRGGQGNATPGQGIGSGIFLHGNGSFSVAPGAGQTQTISDIIVDQTGAGGTGTDSGSWSLVKNGDGVTVLTGANAYSGGTIVNAGILQGKTSSLRGNITNNASVIFDQAGNDGTFAGNMSGSGALFKRGGGVLSLTGTNTYAAGTRVEEGVLRIASDAKLGAAGTHLNLDGGGGLSASATFASTRPVWLTGARGIVLVDAGETLTLSGVVSESGALVKSGPGDLILSGANTYSGGTTVTGGVLRFANDANLGAAATGIMLNGGAVGTMTDTPAATSISRNITLASNGGGIDVAAQSQSLSWSGNISGNGGLFKTGAGTLVLTGNNTYTGGTQVAGGTLWVASDAKLGAAGTHVDLNNGALRASETFTSARPVGLLGAGGAILVDANKSLTLSGVVRGSGSLTKTGDGTLILTGANAYTGNITVNAGVLQGNTMSLLAHITNNASVVFDQAANGTYAGNITGLGSLTKIGAGTLILPAAANYAGGTTVSAGALQGTTFSLQGNILNNAAVIFDQGFDGTYAGNMTGTGTLTKNGPGTLTLTGTSSVDGGMTVDAGALLANGSIASSRGLRVNTRATVGGTGILPSTIINGGTLSPGNSIGTINIIGKLTFGAGSIYAVEVSGGAADRASVIGSADLSGGTVDVTFLAGGSVSRNYTILNATGGLG
ncbi:autotransporter-associated beta strand repeat-containing protein, partial [Mesorhizobium sp. B2-5-3]|uniref:autotransporter-associated beta strand repeat-containing protein n=1 Tax=Mesorhizobium sp. B2-5-3 TaxID=2589927 RepID=UPI00116AE0A4